MTDSTKSLTIDAQELAVLAQEMGAAVANNSGGNNASRLPELKINSQVDDDKGNQLPRGHFFIKGLEQTAYASDVIFRPLSHSFQYLHYDPEAKKLASKSLIIAHFGEEPRDTKGTLRCGKPISSVLRDMPLNSVRNLPTSPVFARFVGLSLTRARPLMERKWFMKTNR